MGQALSLGLGEWERQRLASTPGNVDELAKGMGKRVSVSETLNISLAVVVYRGIYSL